MRRELKWLVAVELVVEWMVQLADSLQLKNFTMNKWENLVSTCTLIKIIKTHLKDIFRDKKEHIISRFTYFPTINQVVVEVRFLSI